VEGNCGLAGSRWSGFSQGIRNHYPTAPKSARDEAGSFALNTRSTHRYSPPLLFGCALLVGLATGWTASSRLEIAASPEAQQAYLQDKGDAAEAVRAGVTESLRAFQDGYTKRDPVQIDTFMKRVFRDSQEALLMGTDANEWKHGYAPIARFIETDWREWGKVQIDVDNARISSAGDVAWLATTGCVLMSHSSRPIRFTAVLALHDGLWFFRQVQFQWDESPVTLFDFVHPARRSQISIR
jgi:hypothetical protein